MGAESIEHGVQTMEFRATDNKKNKSLLHISRIKVV